MSGLPKDTREEDTEEEMKRYTQCENNSSFYVSRGSSRKVRVTGVSKGSQITETKQRGSFKTQKLTSKVKFYRQVELAIRGH